MKIPKRFTVGYKKYTVQTPPQIAKHVWGRTYLDAGIMKIATHPDKRKRKLNGSDGQHETFWHEVVHTILYDMGHTLNKDEAFVTAFSSKLNQIIESAEL